jgi:hypothetical protein
MSYQSNNDLSHLGRVDKYSFKVQLVLALESGGVEGFVM